MSCIKSCVVLNICLVFVLHQVLYDTEESQVFVLYQVLCGTEEIQVFVLYQVLCSTEEIQVFVLHQIFRGMKRFKSLPCVKSCAVLRRY